MLTGDARRLDAVESEMAHALAHQVVARHVPTLAPVDQCVRLHRAARELVLVLLVVLERQQIAPSDRARYDGRDLGVVAARGGDLETFLDRVLAEARGDLLAHGGERTGGG